MKFWKEDAYLVAGFLELWQGPENIFCKSFLCLNFKLNNMYLIFHKGALKVFQCCILCYFVKNLDWI